MQHNNLLTIYVSLFVAYLMLLMPWSENALVYRPDFTLLVLIFWMIRAPNLCNIGTAWFIGLMVDLATGGIFGQYAWAYSVAAFFTTMYQRRLILFTNMQQFFYVLLVLLIAQVTLLILRTFSGASFPGWVYFAPSLIGVLLWSLTFLFKIHNEH